MPKIKKELIVEGPSRSFPVDLYKHSAVVGSVTAHELALAIDAVIHNTGRTISAIHSVKDEDGNEMVVLALALS